MRAHAHKHTHTENMDSSLWSLPLVKRDSDALRLLEVYTPNLPLAQALEVNGRGTGAGEGVAVIQISDQLQIRYMNILSKNRMYDSENRYNLN